MNDKDFQLIRGLVDDGCLEVSKDNPLYGKIKTLFRVDEYDEGLGNFFITDLTGEKDDYFHEGWNSFVFFYDPKRWTIRRIDEGRKDDGDANDKKEVKRKMDEFKNLINNGFAEIDTARSVSFELAIEIGKELNPYLRSQPKLSKKSVSEDNRFILLGKEYERDQVEMRRGMTYFYNPTMWRVKSLDNEYEINKGWHDEIELDERSKEILDSIWPVIYGRVMQMIDCGQ